MLSDYIEEVCHLINKAIIIATGVARFVVTELCCMHTPTMPATSISGLCIHLHIGRYTRMSTIHHILACFQLQIPQSMQPEGTIISVVAIIYSQWSCVCLCVYCTYVASC